jgi:hypothetical protein
MALTRIKTNQITDLAVTTGKIANSAVTAAKLANNLTYGSDLTVSGNLTVGGTTTAVQTDNTRITDAVITLSEGGNGSVDAGLLIDRGAGAVGSASANQAFLWDESANEFALADVGTDDGDATTNLTIGAYANLQVAELTATGATAGNVQVGVTGDNEIDTSSGNLTIDSAGGTITLDDNVVISGTLDASSGNLTTNVSNTQVMFSSSGVITGSSSLVWDGTDLTVGSAVVSDLTSGRVVLAGTSGAIEDSGNLTFDGSTLDVTGAVTASGVVTGGSLTDGTATISSGALSGATTGAFSSNVTVGGTLGVTGESTLASATVSDLTSGRVVLAGTSGAIEDSGNLTFNGSTLAVTGAATISTTLGVTGTTTAGIVNLSGLLSADGGIDVDGAFTVADTTGNVATTGTLSAGATTLSSAAVSDLTDNRIVIAGTSGELEDDANLTFDGTTFEVGGGYGATGLDIAMDGNISTNGTLTVDGTSTLGVVNASGLASLDGGIDVDGAFTVADTTGNVVTTGTINTGAATLSSAAVSDLTDNRIVIAGTSGELEDDANLTFDGTTFEVGGGYGATGLDIAMDGNVSTNGSLTVDGTSTLGVINASGLASLDAGIDVDGAFTVANGNGNIGTTGTLNVDGATTLNGAVTLGDASGDAITVTGTATFGASADFDGGFTVAAAQTIDVGGNQIDNVADPTAAQDAATKAYVDSQVSTASALVIAADSGSNDTVTIGSDTLTFAGTANEITTAVTDNTITIGLPDDVTIAGNLTVSGTTTTVNSTTTELEDPVMRLGVTGLSEDGGKDRGIEFLYYDGSEQTGFFGWDNDANAFVFLTGATNASEVFSGTAGAATFGAITGTTITGTGTATLNDAAIGGGYGSTGVTISAAGVIQANGAITSDGAITGGSLTDGTATLSSGALSGATTGAFSSNVTVGGTLGVTGESTLASATVSDLTDNRIVIAGTSGALEDSANLTFDGTTFEVGGGYGATGLDIAMDGNVSTNGTITADGTITGGSLTDGTATLSSGALSGATTGAFSSNVTVGGTLGVTGESTLASATVSDLTNNRIVIAGASGALEDDANLTFDGTTFEVGGGYGATGLDIAMDGNISTNGTLTVDGTSTLGVVNVSGLASLDGGIDVDGAFTVADTTGNVSTTGTLTAGNTDVGTLDASGLASLDGGIDVDGAFTVADTTGNVSTSGTLDVTGTSTLGVINASGLASLDAGIDVDGAFTVADTTGNVSTSGTLDVTGTSTLGVINASGLASLDGGIDVDGAFTVADTSGNVATTGTLSAGETTLSSATVSDLTSGRVVLAGTSGAIEDSGNLTFNGSTLAVTGAATISTTLGVTGESTLASATVSDLTSGRVVLAGTSGAIEDSGNLTFNGSTLAVTGAITASSNVDIADAGSLRVGTGNDFTINHDGTDTTITNGTGILKIDGTATSSIRVNEAGANVDFVVEGDTNNALLTVDASGDNVGIGGAPNANAVFHVNDTGSMILPVGTTAQRPTGVTGMFRYNSTVGGIEYHNGSDWSGISSDFTVATSQTFNGDNSTTDFTLSALSGADSYSVAGVFVTLNGVVQEPTTVYGISGTTLSFTSAPASGDLIEVRKFTTTTVINALADVDGDTQIQVEESSDEDVIRFDIGGSEKMVLNATQLSVTGNIVATGDITANGDITLGDANTDTITLGAEIGSDIIPDTDGSRDLGSATNRWAEAHIDDVLLGPQGDIRFYDSDASNFVAFQSAGTVASDITWTLPSADAAVSGYALVSNGSGTLSWAAAGATTTSDTTTNAEEQLYFGDITSGAVTAVHHDADLTYNPSTGSLSSDVFIGALTGNASTATALETARTIGGVSFDGTANINLAGVNTTGNQDTSGNAATATALETARTIGGVSFDGTANINLAGVNTAGNQDTSGNAATATTATNVNVTANNTANETVYLTFVDGATGAQGIETDTGLSYNPSTNVLSTTATNAQYADLAEMYASDEDIEAGTIVCFVGDGKVAACDQDACRSVAGIISTDPAYLMNSVQEGVALALVGRVPCKVTGPVAAGDLMVSAGNGMARAEANPSIGTVIGKAIEANEDGEGVIEVLALMM